MHLIRYARRSGHNPVTDMHPFVIAVTRISASG